MNLIDDDRDAEQGRSRDPEWEAQRAEALRTERREPAKLIWQAWERGLDEREAERVRAFVATRGFDPFLEVPLPRNLWGSEYEGRIYGPRERELTGIVHYLNHAADRQEWPDGTTEEEYYLDINDIVLDPRSNMFVSRFRDEETGEWRAQLGFIGRSEDAHTGDSMRGPGGQRDVLVEFRLDRGHITTAFQLPDGRAHVERQAKEGKRRDLVWLS